MTRLIPINIPKHQRKALKTRTFHTKNNFRITRFDADTALRFKQTQYMTDTQASQMANLLNTQNILSNVLEKSSILKKDTDYLFSLNEDKDITGCIRMKCYPRRERKTPNKKGRYVSETHISKFTVIEKEQRKGIGSQLLYSVEEKAAKQGTTHINAKVHTNNTKGTMFFSKHGYKPTFIFYDSATAQNVSHWTKTLR